MLGKAENCPTIVSVFFAKSIIMFVIVILFFSTNQNSDWRNRYFENKKILGSKLWNFNFFLMSLQNETYKKMNKDKFLFIKNRDIFAKFGYNTWEIFLFEEVKILEFTINPIGVN